MALQIFLGGQEIESIESTIDLPISKTFESLASPTSIIVEHSKSINIPMTKRNNLILGNIYRLDREVMNAVDNDTNIGMFLDATKKIDLKLLYNNELILSGYAKFDSATYTEKQKFYTISIYGKLGDIFQQLLDVVVDEKQLKRVHKNEPDRAKYILDDGLPGVILDKEYIISSWNRDVNKITGNIDSTDVIGFAPAYRGKYQNFEPTMIEYETQDGPVTNSLTTYLEAEWYQKYYDKYISEGFDSKQADAKAKDMVESLKLSELVGEGLPDYQMEEYRAYEMKPYIYFNQLMQMYIRKCKELTGYDIVLDKTWFNVNNPYWTRMCFMLDFLESAGLPNDSKKTVAEPKKSAATIQNTSTTRHASYNIMSTLTDADIKNKNTVVLKPADLVLKGSYIIDKNYYITGLEVDKDTTINIKIDLYNGTYYSGNRLSTKYFWYCPNGAYGNNYNYNSNIYTPDNFIVPETSNTTGDGKEIVYTTFKLPELRLDSTSPLSENIIMEITVDMYNQSAKDGSTGIYSYKQFIYSPDFGRREVTIMVNPTDNINDFNLTQAVVSFDSSWRTNTHVKLKELYFQDKPLFNIILDYTKMFRLYWSIDYATSTITIQTPKTVFKDYTVTNWNDRLDKSREFRIEPVSFPNQFIKFNYQKVNGYRYTGYQDRYDMNIGEKIIRTNYHFDTETADLFRNINPSSASSKSYWTFKQLVNWNIEDGLYSLQALPDKKTLIDAETDDEKSGLSVQNWYLRGQNYRLDSPVYVTSDSTKMVEDGKYCYLEHAYAEKNKLSIATIQFPNFNIVFQDERYFEAFPGQVIGGIFNCPNEDFSSNKLITKAEGNYIYDNFWQDYLNERYNVQNKKITGYFNFHPSEFARFNFNHFVEINNQLFMVNRIIDYNINSSETSKMELIQITEPEKYFISKFEFKPIVAKPVYIKANTESYPADKGDYIIKIHASPVVNSILLMTDNQYFGKVTAKIQSTDKDTGLVEVKLHFEGLGLHKEIWQGKLWTSNLENETEIPIEIDFSGWNAAADYKIVANPNNINLVPDTAQGDFNVTFKSADKVKDIRIVQNGHTQGKVWLKNLNITRDNAGVYSTVAQFSYSGLDLSHEKWQGNIYASNSRTATEVPTVIDFTNYGNVWRVYFDGDAGLFWSYKGKETTVKEGDMFACNITPEYGYLIDTVEVYDDRGLIEDAWNGADTVIVDAVTSDIQIIASSKLANPASAEGAAIYNL